MADGSTCPYQPGALIHDGHSGPVFTARDATGARVVLKRLRDGADRLGALRFEREAALGAMLAHPGLARLLDHGPGWMAFEPLAPALSDPQVRQEHAAPDAARRLLAQLAATLAFLHARGVVHRDVKPAHVMFRSDRPVLIDLGVAGLISDDPLEGSECVGSPAWMAPEQASGARPAPPADIWSFGALGAWLLLGAAPYAGSADDVLERRRRGDPPGFGFAELRGIDAALAALVEACLGEAGRRPSAAAIVNALG